MQHINHLNLEQKNWFELNDNSRGTYGITKPIKFRNSMLKLNLCDYSDAL